MTTKSTIQEANHGTVKLPFVDYFFIACLLFAIFMGTVAYTGMKANQLLEWKDLELREARQMQHELERQYRQAVGELEILRAEYEAMEAQRDEQKAKIRTLLVKQELP
ncbi:MAG: hypothetical protein AAB316_03430 [Bacteroidota bacterium]